MRDIGVMFSSGGVVVRFRLKAAGDSEAELTRLGGMEVDISHRGGLADQAGFTTENDHVGHLRGRDGQIARMNDGTGKRRRIRRKKRVDGQEERNKPQAP